MASRPFTGTPSVRLIHANGSFWNATVMATGTWVSVVTGPIDDPGRCRAKIHKFATEVQARVAFDEFVRQAEADGFVDPRSLLPPPPRASTEGLSRLDDALGRLRSAALQLAVGEPCVIHLDGELARLGAGGGRTWQLSPTYRSFLERYGHLTVESGDSALRIHGAKGAALATEDFESALVDHRYGEWPFENLSKYGLDSAVVFAGSGRGWNDGWAFDTRIVGSDGEYAIRRTYDFSADGGASMCAAWPSNDELAGHRSQSFADWLVDRADEIVRLASV